MRALIIEDDKVYSRSLTRIVAEEGLDTTVAHSGEEGLALLGDLQPEIAYVDIGLPGIDGVQVVERITAQEPETLCIIVSGHADFKTAVAAMRAGAFDFLAKTSRAEEIQFRTRKAREIINLRRQVDSLRSAEESTRFVGRSPAMRRVFQQIEQVAGAPTSTVLIIGDTGTGKELVAREIHRRSDRHDRPLVCVNCASIPDQLIESEFMGHERGAFTGADRPKKGLLELADGGVLFLDEVGELAPGLQAKLLRVIEERRFKRVGGVKELQVDVRFVAATNKDLEARAASGEFREDLLYRLNVFQIRVPPLRERGEDVLLLAEYFVEQLNSQLGRRIKQLEPGLRRALGRYTFPGNVRQLRNMVEQAMILAKGDTLTLASFPALEQPAQARPAAPPAAVTAGEAPLELNAAPPHQLLEQIQARADELEQQERQVVEHALQLAEGNKTEAARLLHISRYSLQRRMRRMAIG